MVWQCWVFFLYCSVWHLCCERICHFEDLKKFEILTLIVPRAFSVTVWDEIFSITADTCLPRPYYCLEEFQDSNTYSTEGLL